jgi:hypothetical protein
LHNLAQELGIVKPENWQTQLQSALNQLPASLLILDNLDDFDGEAWEKIRPLVNLLRSGKHRLLITSRCEPLADLAAPFALNYWNEQQARDFLLERVLET